LNLATALGVSTATAALPAPSSLTATAASSAEIVLTWADNSSSETGFEIQRSTDNTTFSGAGTAAANATSFSVGGLNANTTYYFRIRAVSDSAASAFSDVTNATTLTRRAKRGK
jgi:predicted phage tail protein